MANLKIQLLLRYRTQGVRHQSPTLKNVSNNQNESLKLNKMKSKPKGEYLKAQPHRGTTEEFEFRRTLLNFSA